MDGPLRKMLEAEGVGPEEFSHRYWGSKPLNTYIDKTSSIDAGCKTPDIEITAFCMLGFMESPGGYRSWLMEVTTRSMLCKDLLNIVRLPRSRLVPTQAHSVKRYNDIADEQFKIPTLLKDWMQWTNCQEYVADPSVHCFGV